jgi:hypothetical protein
MRRLRAWRFSKILNTLIEMLLTQLIFIREFIELLIRFWQELFQNLIVNRLVEKCEHLRSDISFKTKISIICEHTFDSKRISYSFRVFFMPLSSSFMSNWTFSSETIAALSMNVSSESKLVISGNFSVTVCTIKCKSVCFLSWVFVSNSFKQINFF